MRTCLYPPGCDAPAMPGRNACQPHYILVSALMGNPDEPGPTDAEIAWANRMTSTATPHDELLRAAYHLLGDGAGSEWENSEYTRGIVELVGDLSHGRYGPLGDFTTHETIQAAIRHSVVGDRG